MTLGQLSESAYWMAYVRALEAERPDALFGLDILQPGQQFHFGPADSVRFFAQLGWPEAEFHSSSREAGRLRRAPPLPSLARLLMSLSARSDREQYQRLAGISVLTRDTLPG
jgi:hypothetical protein